MEKLENIQLSFKCTKKLDELIPCNGGWYCNGCEKVVQDFRGKSEKEIKLTFAKHDYQLCGMFEADRIRVKNPLTKWFKWVSAAALALGLQACTKDFWPIVAPKANSLSLNKNSPVVQNEIFGTVEQQASYIGGMDKFHAYVIANLKPDSSCQAGDKAFVTFTIDTDGSVIKIKLLRSPFSKQVNARIIEVIGRSRRWSPGMLRGRIVKSQFTIPVMPLFK